MTFEIGTKTRKTDSSSVIFTPYKRQFESSYANKLQPTTAETIEDSKVFYNLPSVVEVIEVKLPVENVVEKAE